MIARFRSWWKNTSKTLDAVIILSLVILFVLLVLIILGYIYNWTWAGLHGKTLYDWLQLLIIPAVLAVGSYLFNYATGRTEREVASNRQQEEALQAYIDNISALLLEKNLRKSGEYDEVRTIARVRTLTVLPRLDGRRKKSVLQFLHESELIEKNQKIIDLDWADFSGADLRVTDLTEANLSGANLIKANLSEVSLHSADLSGAELGEANLGNADLSEASLFCTNLRGANLSGANLKGANLSGANLTGAKVNDEQLDKAKSLEGATMPDGTKHD